MRWYRAFRMSDDGTTVTMKDGVRFGAGSSTSPNTLSTNERGTNSYYTSAATSGTTYGRYCYLAGTGVGAEFIGGRDKVVLSAAAGNAHGTHSTVEISSTGYATGLCTGVRGNLVFATDSIVPYGTYYGVMGEIYAAGGSSTMPTSNACLCASIPAGTLIDHVANVLAINCNAGAGHAVVEATDSSPDWTGSFRIIVNGALRYVHYTSVEAS